jgi:hypothetical protein
MTLPLYFPQGDGLAPLGGDGLGTATLGDLRLQATATLWPGASGPLAVAIATVVSLPTGESGRLAGLGTVGFEPRFLIALEPVAPLRILAQVGVALHGERELFGSVWGRRLTWAAGVELGLPWLPWIGRYLALAGEADGTSCGGCEAESPAEIRAGVRVRWRWLRASLAGGGGLSEGAMVPSWRLLGSTTVVWR